jgi:hypothetical protein
VALGSPGGGAESPPDRRTRIPRPVDSVIEKMRRCADPHCRVVHPYQSTTGTSGSALQVLTGLETVLFVTTDMMNARKTFFDRRLKAVDRILIPHAGGRVPASVSFDSLRGSGRGVRDSGGGR